MKKFLLISFLFLIAIGYGAYAQKTNVALPGCGNMGTPVILSHTVVTQTTTTAGVRLTWTNVSGATLYQLYYGLQGGSLSNSGCTASGCTVNGLLLGRTYDFQVDASRMCTNEENQQVSETTSATATITIYPEAPAGLAANSISPTSFTATWGACTGADFYRIDVATDSDFSSLVLNNAFNVTTSRQVTELTPNTVYYFRVRAGNAGGASANSATFPISTLPAAPVNLGVSSMTQTSFVASWSASVGATDGYQLGVSTSRDFSTGNVLTDFPVSGTSQHVSPLTPGIEYFITVRAVKGNLFSPYSPVISATIPLPPSEYVNFVQKQIPLVENITTLPQLEALPFTQLNTTTSYLDGFARQIEEVQKASSPQGKDIVSINEYDFISREPRKFLPYASSETAGLFVPGPTAHTLLNSFYQSSNDNIANTAFPYAETIFESSPLNRVLNQGAPGEEWQISNGHAKSMGYTGNDVEDEIWIWTSTPQGVSASGYYPDGTLLVTEMTDEDGKKAREFKDKSGQVVVSERIIEGGVKLRTYFVFDVMGRLSHVLPPKTISELPDSSNVSIPNDVLSRECFRYKYDSRSRVIEKHIPGAGLQCSVYDQWDRVVLTQHANQRTQNKWLFNKYDAFNRPIMNGEIILQTDQAGATEAIDNFYENVAANPSLRFEERGNVIHGYTNRSFPVLTNENQACNIMYFDNYDFLTQPDTVYQFAPQPDLGLTENFARVQSQPTGSKTKILGTDNYLKNVIYYDDRLRSIQVVSDNHLGGIDKASSVYDFTGKVLKVKTEHHGLQSVTILQENTYDHANRLLKVFHKANNGPRVLLASHKYNELGQLIEKNLHSLDSGNTYLQSLDYSYNERGWLLQVNPEEADENTRYSDLYGFELSYTTPPDGITDFQPSFSGNITAFTETRPTRLEDNNAQFNSTFTYRYDDRAQLKSASYFQPSDPSKDHVYDLPEVTYDDNGNIRKLRRNGVTPFQHLDDLEYFYNGNQLISVRELGDPAKGFKMRD